MLDLCRFHSVSPVGRRNPQAPYVPPPDEPSAKEDLVRFAGVGRMGDRLALRISEVAVLLSISDDTVSRMVKAGHLPVVRLRGAVRIPRRSLEAWLEQQASHGVGDD